MSKARSKSVYGERAGEKAIYGISSIPPCNPRECTDMFPLALYLDSLTNTIGNMIGVINKFFPEIKSYAPVIGDMRALQAAPPAIFVRLVWAKRFPNEEFVNDRLHNLQLKQIYLEFQQRWQDDMYLVAGLGTT